MEMLYEKALYLLFYHRKADGPADYKVHFIITPSNQHIQILNIFRTSYAFRIRHYYLQTARLVAVSK